MNTHSRPSIADAFTDADWEGVSAALAEARNLSAVRAALPPCQENRMWRVFRDGKDLGVAFSLEGASAAVKHLRRGHWKPCARSLPHFRLAPDTVRGAVPFGRCAVAQ